eukprot:2989544-Rhodomonas_salina.1
MQLRYGPRQLRYGPMKLRYGPMQLRDVPMQLRDVPVRRFEFRDVYMQLSRVPMQARYASANAMQCPVLTSRTGLLAYAHPTHTLRTPYAMPGTDPAYGATSTAPSSAQPSLSLSGRSDSHSAPGMLAVM